MYPTDTYTLTALTAERQRTLLDQASLRRLARATPCHRAESSPRRLVAAPAPAGSAANARGRLTPAPRKLLVAGHTSSASMRATRAAPSVSTGR